MTFKLLVAVLVAYAGWRLWHDGFGAGRRRVAKPAETGELAEARAVLGLGPAPSEAEIRAAHRRLVRAVHPDHGGSEELTRRINQARDVLLKARSA